MPAEKIRYFHLAGHYVEAGGPANRHAWRDVDDQADCLPRREIRPCADTARLYFNFPPMDVLLAEVDKIRDYQNESIRGGRQWLTAGIPGSNTLRGAHPRSTERTGAGGHRRPPDGDLRNLFFNNLRNLLATFYPVRKLHDDDHWKRFIRSSCRSTRLRRPTSYRCP